MRASAVAGIVFANTNDENFNNLTYNRSMASVPFGSRYRLIDFSLSNLVNAGVYSVGIITKENYRSLMDHIGNGVYWDLDRKNGGLYLLPPYLTTGIKKYNGTIDALYGAKDYIDKCKAEYIIMCNADTIANIDLSSAIKQHIKLNSDISIIYKTGIAPTNSKDTVILDIENVNQIKKISPSFESDKILNYSLGITIIKRDILLKIIKKAHENDLISFNRDILVKEYNQYKISGYKHEEFAAIMDNPVAYYQSNMDLLNKETRKQLFNIKRPVFTKTRDDMPTRYGTKSNVSNCLIADGCVINGCVKNSILFRGVVVEKDAVVENCILMQETKVCKSSQLLNVISDKNAVIGEDMILKGTKNKPFFIKKNQIL